MPPRTLRALILLAALVAGLFLRLRGLGDDFLFGDEHHSLFQKDRPYAEILSDFDDRGSHAALPALLRASAQVFGGGVLVYRLAALLPGLASLLLVLAVARRLVGANAAALCTLALALSPVHVFYSRFSRGYALGAALTLALVWCLLVRRESPSSRRAPLGALLAGALAPWVHLTNVASVTGAFAVAAFTDRGRWRSYALGLGGAGLVCAALFWPAREPMRAYLTRIGSAEEVGPTGWLDVPAALMGGPLPGLVAVLALGPALWVLGRGNRVKFLWLVAGIAAPLAFLLVSRPQGMVFAWTRYLFPALPFVWMVLAGAWVAALRSEVLALGLGAAALVVAAWLGPLGPAEPEDGPFSMTYLAMSRLSAFDVPWTEASDYYEALAADDEVEAIVECPELGNRAVLLYRNHYLRHGKRTLLGWSKEWPGLEGAPTLSSDLYVDLADPGFPGDVDADRFILHKNPGDEASRYWSFVFEEAWPATRRWGDQGFMLSQRRIPGRSREVADLRAALLQRLGAPIFEDDDLVVWRLR